MTPRCVCREVMMRDVVLNKVVRLPRDQIGEQQDRTSLTPSSLADHRPRKKLRDLFRYPPSQATVDIESILTVQRTPAFPVDFMIVA